jgi:predicted RNase H-like HicB family nuclease
VRVASVVKTYTIVLEPDPEAGGFTVLVPALPGCVTEGATVEEALANAREAISLTLEDRMARGEPVPDDAPGVRVERVSVSLAS